MKYSCNDCKNNELNIKSITNRGGCGVVFNNWTCKGGKECPRFELIQDKK